jgi:flagellar assembly protein FliH
MSGVLRGVALHAQPVTIGRTRAPLRDPAPPVEAPRIDFDEMLAQARSEGFEAGRAEETRVRDEEWAATIEATKTEAQREGREHGLREGLLEAKARGEQLQQEIAQAAQESLERLDALLASAAQAVEQWRSESEDDLVGLAHDIACRILGARAVERQALEQMTRHVLREHGPRAPLAVHVHPDDFEHIAQSPAPRATAWEWVADPAIALGGVVLRSPQGSLDARLDAQLRALGEALVAQRDERRRARSEDKS